MKLAKNIAISSLLLSSFAQAVQLETTLSQVDIDQHAEVLLEAVQDSFKGLSVSLPQSRESPVIQALAETTENSDGLYLTDESGNHMISFENNVITVEDGGQIDITTLGFENFDEWAQYYCFDSLDDLQSNVVASGLWDIINNSINGGEGPVCSNPDDSTALVQQDYEEEADVESIDEITDDTNEELDSENSSNSTETASSNSTSTDTTSSDSSNDDQSDSSGTQDATISEISEAKEEEDISSSDENGTTETTIMSPEDIEEYENSSSEDETGDLSDLLTDLESTSSEDEMDGLSSLLTDLQNMDTSGLSLQNQDDPTSTIVMTADDPLILTYEVENVADLIASATTIDQVISTDSGYVYDYQDTTDATYYISTDPNVLVNYESSYDDLSEAITAQYINLMEFTDNQKDELQEYQEYLVQTESELLQEVLDYIEYTQVMLDLFKEEQKDDLQDYIQINNALLTGTIDSMDTLYDQDVTVTVSNDADSIYVQTIDGVNYMGSSAVNIVQYDQPDYIVVDSSTPTVIYQDTPEYVVLDTSSPSTVTYLPTTDNAEVVQVTSDPIYISDDTMYMTQDQYIVVDSSDVPTVYTVDDQLLSTSQTGLSGLQDVPYESDDLVYIVDSSILYMDYPDTSSSSSIVYTTDSSSSIVYTTDVSSTTTYYVVDTSIYGSSMIYIDQYGQLIDPYYILAYPSNYVVVNTNPLPVGTVYVDVFGQMIFPQVVFVNSYYTDPSLSVYSVTEQPLQSTVYIDQYGNVIYQEPPEVSVYVTDSQPSDIAVSTDDQIIVTSGDNTVMADSDDIYVLENANIDDLNIIYDDYGQPSIAVVEFEDQSYWSSDNNLIVSVQPSSSNEPIVTTLPSDYENVTQQSISAIEDLMSSISY